MLQFLETGNALYVLAAVCLLSLLGKLVIRNLYRRLIRETDNMALTKNKYLKTLKQKAENTYRMNQGITNTQVYLEKQLYSIRFMGMSLNGWGNFSNQMSLLCFLLGGVGAFVSYWYRFDSYYIVLYGSVGILAGLFTIVVDYGLNPSDKKQHLMISLQDYLENSLFGRLVKERADIVSEEEEIQEPVRSTIRENSRIVDRSVLDRSGNERESAQRTVPERNSTASKRGGRNARREPVEVQETTSRRDIDYLKRSLEQIAASREKSREDENWVKDLDANEIKLIGEILREYLS